MKNKEIKVLGKQEFLGKEIPVIEGGFGEGQKVVLAKTVAEIHDVELKKINELINNNIDEFEEDIDLLNLKNNGLYQVPLSELGFSNRDIAISKNIYLLSEQGYMALVGLMRTDKARELRKKFRREYFSMKQALRVLTREQELILDIHSGGLPAIEAHKELEKRKEEEFKIREGEIRKQAENALSKAQKDAKDKIEKLQDGNGKMLSVGQLVESLDIPKLNTSMFNKWLCSKNFGEYKLFTGDKNRTFQPNHNFKEYISGKGYSMTGTTKNGKKIIVMYNEEMANRIIDKYYNEIVEFVESQIGF